MSSKLPIFESFDNEKATQINESGGQVLSAILNLEKEVQSWSMDAGNTRLPIPNKWAGIELDFKSMKRRYKNMVLQQSKMAGSILGMLEKIRNLVSAGESVDPNGALGMRKTIINLYEGIVENSMDKVIEEITAMGLKFHGTSGFILNAAWDTMRFGNNEDKDRWAVNMTFQFSGTEKKTLVLRPQVISTQ